MSEDFLLGRPIVEGPVEPDEDITILPFRYVARLTNLTKELALDLNAYCYCGVLAVVIDNGYRRD